MSSARTPEEEFVAAGAKSEEEEDQEGVGGGGGGGGGLQRVSQEAFRAGNRHSKGPEINLGK